MSGINKVIIIGNLGANPEVHQFQNGGSVTNISVATSEQWTNRFGEPQESTEWHRVQLFNRLGEVASTYLSKGSKVYIEGSLKTRKWTDDNGVDRYVTEIRANHMQMLSSVPKQNPSPSWTDPSNPTRQSNDPSHSRGVQEKTQPLAIDKQPSTSSSLTKPVVPATVQTTSTQTSTPPHHQTKSDDPFDDIPFPF